MLKDYCKLLRREYKKVLGKAQIETNKAESKLPKRIMANEYDELMLRRIYKKDGNVFLVFDSGTLKIINCEIIEREEKRLYQYKRKEPYSGWSMVLYAEVSYENGLFALHLMIDRIWSAGKASYVERNQDMIASSDYCIFYYNSQYLPPKRKYSKHSVGEYQPKSGTALAYEYAWNRKRAQKLASIINVWEMLCWVE